jgi:ABC-type bacteriocin/lantibiotic exporter with double-glycine peptidase domain
MRGFFLAGLVVLLGGPWIAAETAPMPRRAINSAVWIDVPFVAQTTDGCGSASIAMVMQYWDRKRQRALAADAEPEHIQAALFSRAADGIYASAMRKYFLRSGYRAFAFQGRWSDFEHQLALGRPLIVGIGASGPLGPLHYVVIVGIDPERNYLFMNDPAQQKMLRISRQGFEQEWRATHNWTLLAVPETAP